MFIRTCGIIIAVCMMAATVAFAQPGGAAVPFLLITPDARASAMGDVGTATTDDINSVFWNPGGLAFNQADNQVALSYSKWLPQFNADLFYSYGTYGQYVEDLGGTLAATFIFMNLGEFTKTNEAGQALGKFRSNEFCLGVSYGTEISDEVGLGVQVKYIQSNLAPASVGASGAGIGISGAFDLGVMWRPRDESIKGLSVGANLQNVGPKMTYDKESDPLPTNLRLGVAYNAYEDEFLRWTVTAEAMKLLVRRDGKNSDPIPISLITAWGKGGIETGLGTELLIDKVFATRLGFFTEPSAAGGRQYFTAGAGVKYDIFRADFSYYITVERNHPLGNTLRFSLIVDWGEGTMDSADG
ncbi:MAG: hypothetical protein RLZZ273_1891 [Bacteroidota bacterium]